MWSSPIQNQSVWKEKLWVDRKKKFLSKGLLWVTIKDFGISTLRSLRRGEYHLFGIRLKARGQVLTFVPFQLVLECLIRNLPFVRSLRKVLFLFKSHGWLHVTTSFIVTLCWLLAWVYFWLHIDCKGLEGRGHLLNSFVIIFPPMSSIHSFNKYLLSANSARHWVYKAE